MHSTFFSETWAELAGTVVVNLLWQGTLIGVLVAVALAATRKRSPNLRYALTCAGLLLIAALLPANFAWLATRDTSVSPPATQAAADPSLAPATPEPAFSPSDRSAPSSPKFPSRYPSDSASPNHPARPQFSAVQWYHLSLPWLGRLWAAGIVCFALYDLAGLFALSRLRAKSQAVGEDIAALARRVQDRLGVRVRVQVRWLAGISSALVTGFFRTIILLPASMATRMTPDEIEAILAHEFAHIRRWDLWVNTFQRVVEALLFFHPVVWWLSKTIRAERELCCDELALRAYPNRAQYVRALLTLAETTQQTEALALSSHGGSLVNRVRRILGRNRTEQTKELGRLMSVFLVFVTAAVFLMYGLNSIDAAAQKSSVNVDWLLSVVREKQVQIKSFRSEVTKTVEAPLWESDPGITGRPVEFIYDDYILSGSMFRVFGRAGDGPDDELGTLDEYWNGTVAIEYDARNRQGKISAMKPRQAINTPFDAAMLRTTGADYGPYLEDILLRLAPTATEIAEGEYKGMILVESNDHRYRIWLDPARNLLPVRRETYYRQTGPESSDGAATHLAEYTHLLVEAKEFLPGLWLPTKWQRIRRIGPPAPEEQWGQVSVIATYEVGMIEVNEEYPDSIFSFSFPPGTEVTDSRTDPPTMLNVGASVAQDRDAALQQIRAAEANLRNAQFKMESQVYQRSPEGELVASEQFSKVEGLIAPGVRARYHVEIEAGVPAVVKREGKMELSTSHDRMEVSFDGTTQTVRSDSLQESRSTTPGSWQGQRGYTALFSNRLTHVLPLYEAMGLSAYLATIPDEAPEWKVVPSDDASRLTVWFPRANFVPEGLQDKMSYLVTLDLARGGNIVDWRWYLDYDSERPQLMAALEDVRLEQIGGVWLPVHFVQREFRHDPPAAGNSVQEETRTAIEWSHVNAELGPDAFRIVYSALPESYWILAHLVLPKDWSPTQQREVLESVTDYQQIASTEMGKSRYACRFVIPRRMWEQVIEGVRASGTSVSTYTDEDAVSFDERFPKQESWWKDSEGNPVTLEWWNPESVRTPERIGWQEDWPDTPKKWVWALFGQDDKGGTVVYVRAQTD